MVLLDPIVRSSVGSIPRENYGSGTDKLYQDSDEGVNPFYDSKYSAARFITLAVSTVQV